MKKLSLVTSMLFLLVFCVAAQEHSSGPTAAEALANLQQGNERYTQGTLQPKDYAQERAALAKTQHPYAIILTCADSRVSPEILFDESLGKLFVIRVAGNVTEPAVLGSIEYAAEHLHSPLLVVLGHEGCGAVAAALAGGTNPKNLSTLIKYIVPAADSAKRKGLGDKQTFDAAVRENVHLQIKRARSQSTVVNEFVKKKELQIVGAVYHLESGQVEWIDRPSEKQ